ncbi:hypothetical protein CpipJ_CPIJ013351 [Culex quinquefasciatus]|uniref:Uncharacterized protein n=1 Tax=Culex quinquefasciatus TaxID=7176 RepID=B0X1A2_CULQU|nr:hypothetical protein CpipJ_CPIJ013351 [Culex quinquefasciatus]|eukprot:XP_001863424.1 hypothetical protein CpipJ_CPIJ013351 [Culex quinquefasciatus]
MDRDVTPAQQRSCIAQIGKTPSEPGPHSSTQQ